MPCVGGVTSMPYRVTLFVFSSPADPTLHLATHRLAALLLPLPSLRYYLRCVAFAYYLPAYVFMLFSIDYLLAQVRSKTYSMGTHAHHRKQSVLVAASAARVCYAAPSRILLVYPGRKSRGPLPCTTSIW